LQVDWYDSKSSAEFMPEMFLLSFSAPWRQQQLPPSGGSTDRHGDEPDTLLGQATMRRVTANAPWEPKQEPSLKSRIEEQTLESFLFLFRSGI